MESVDLLICPMSSLQSYCADNLCKSAKSVDEIPDFVLITSVVARETGTLLFLSCNGFSLPCKQISP